MKRSLFLMVFILIFILTYASESKKIKISIINLPCDLDYIRTELPFIDYVRDQKDADVFLKFSVMETGSGGKKYIANFNGQNVFLDLEESLYFFADNTISEQQLRSKTLHIIKLGISYFLSHTENSDKINIDFSFLSEQKKIIDPWKKWVFTLSANGWFNGDENSKKIGSYNDISISKVTEESRFNFNLGGSYSWEKTSYDTTSYKKILYSIYPSCSYIGSISDHTSWRGSIGYFQNKFSNIKSSNSIGIAYEYNIFPYSKATEKQLRISGTCTPTYYRYYEETVFGKTQQFTLRNSVRISYEIIKGWGSNETSISAKHYVHDTALNNFQLQDELSIRIIKGLSLNFNTSASREHDQIYIAAGELTQEDIYLQKKAIASGYSFWGNIGLSYSFGSIYNNAINPRFGY